MSLFFILLARHYSIEDWSKYLIATSVYQMVAAISTMGLGQWFIREVVNADDKNILVAKFLKMQTYFGFFFFAINLIIVLAIYDDFTMRLLSFLFAFNVVFDNIIYSIKNINIAQFAQKKTVAVLSIEACAKFALACLVYVFPISIVTLAILLVLLRLVSLNLFLRIGAPAGIKLMGFWKVRLPLNNIVVIIKEYWPFAVIGSAYIVYWKIATLIISKKLPLEAVADFENSFKVFSLAQLLPVVIASTALPRMVSLFKEQKIDELRKLYMNLFWFFCIYGIGTYTFMYSFGFQIIPFLFGEKYGETAIYTQEIFLTMLIMPTTFLQAQLLITMKLEKLDMWFNIKRLVLNVLICLVGLYYVKSLSVVNYSIFISFVVLHISQDVTLTRKKLLRVSETIKFFGITALLILCYFWLSKFLNPVILFCSFWIVICTIYYFLYGKSMLDFRKDKTDI
nr:hypothetical protein [Aggregatimonas sangjinii]